MSSKFCHEQVGQLAENKLSYFIHLHKLHSELWAEFVESTKYAVVQICFKQMVIVHGLLPATKRSLTSLYALFSHVLYSVFVSDSICVWSSENENWNGNV